MTLRHEPTPVACVLGELGDGELFRLPGEADYYMLLSAQGDKMVRPKVANLITGCLYEFDWDVVVEPAGRLVAS